MNNIYVRVPTLSKVVQKGQFCLYKKKEVCDYFNIPTAPEKVGAKNQGRYRPEIIIKKI